MHAPGEQVGSRSAHAAHHLLLGHGLAIDALRAADPAARPGVSLNLYSVQPASDEPQDADAARRIDGLQDRFFLDPVLTGRYPDDVLDDLGEHRWFAIQPAQDLELISRPTDFLGVNHHSRHTVAAPDPDGGDDETPGAAFPDSEDVRTVDTGTPRTQMGWPVVPEVHDAPRTDHLQRHVAACASALERGIPLVGYFAWSLVDNFEWARGLSRRFGIVRVDHATQQRTVKSSGAWLRSFLRTGAATDHP